MDLRTSSDERPDAIAPEKNAVNEGITQETSEETFNEKGIRAEKYAYYGLFAANNGIGPYQ